MYLKPITIDNLYDFCDTDYETMSVEDRKKMIAESINKVHNGHYFEFLVVYEEDTIIGFMNLFAHSEHIISCRPSIKTPFQCKGFGCKAEESALEYARQNGFTVAVGGVDENNTVSIRLHEKLGFELDRKYTNNHGRTIRLYIKSLL